MGGGSDNRIGLLLRRLSGLFAVVVAAAGTGVLLGWALHIPRLTGLMSRGLNVKANAGGAFLLAAISLLLLLPERATAGRRWCGRVLAAVVVLVGVLTLFE